MGQWEEILNGSEIYVWVDKGKKMLFSISLVLLTSYQGLRINMMYIFGMKSIKIDHQFFKIMFFKNLLSHRLILSDLVMYSQCIQAVVRMLACAGFLETGGRLEVWFLRIIFLVELKFWGNWSDCLSRTYDMTLQCVVFVLRTKSVKHWLERERMKQ